MSRITIIAQDVLARHQPTSIGGIDQPEARKLVKDAQERIAFVLDSGDAKVARWLIQEMSKTLQHERPGLRAQLEPLLDHLPDIALGSGEIAALALPLAREVEHQRLYAAACIGARKALKSNPIESRAVHARKSA
jgi:hypothetical protein